MHAPFGTEQTPPLKVKIIGGRYVTVLERQPPPTARSDMEALTKSVGKPNVQLDMRKWSDKFHSIVSPRDHPAAKHELSRSPPLPPIPPGAHGSHDYDHDHDYDHHDRQMHEKQVTMRDIAYTLPPAGASSVRGHHLPLPPVGAGNSLPHANATGRNQDASQQNDNSAPLFNLYEVLPKDKYLPGKPIQIDAAHYVALLNELERELSHVNPGIWQQIYIELTTFDRRLGGDVKFNDLCLVLVRNGVFLQPQLLRLLGALFVSAGEGTGARVNYEKIVSFLSACVKYFSDKQRRDLIISGAPIPEPPFELAKHMGPPIASQSVQTLNDSGFGASGDSGHGVPVWDLLDSGYEDKQPEARHNDYPPHPHPQQHHRQHYQDDEPPSQSFNYPERDFPAHMPPPPPPPLPEPKFDREEMEERFREKFYSDRQTQQNTNRDLENIASMKAQDDAEYSRYRQLAIEQLATMRPNQPFDTEALRLHFQRADRNMRGTLSVGQIVDLCQIAHVPIDPALVADIVRKLCAHRGGGQYDWQDFQSFIDKLKPQQTGLNVGANRYARVLPQPEPLPTWPHADPNSLPRLAHPENRGIDGEQPKYYHATQAENSVAPMRAPPHLLPLHLDGDKQKYAGEHTDTIIRGIRQEIDKLEERMTDRNHSNSLDGLRKALEHEHPHHESMHDVAPQRNHSDAVSGLLEQFQLTPRSKDTKWMERYMHLATAIYEHVDAQGFLKAPMARHVVRKQADMLRLMIADIDVEDAMRFSRTVDGRIDTQLFLKRLCRNKLGV